MEDVPKKARRIAEELRLKARALRRIKARALVFRQATSDSGALQEPIDAACAGRLSRTPTPCSCPSCGNPRKYRKGKFRETLAERKERERDVDTG